MTSPFAVPDGPQIDSVSNPPTGYFDPNELSNAHDEMAAIQRITGWIFLAVVGLGCIAVNLALPSTLNEFGENPLISILLGCCMAQVNLIAIWGVMASGRLLLRLPWSIALLTIMWYSLIAGCYIESSAYQMSDALLLGAILITSMPFAMAPLGLMAWIFKWKLTRRQDAKVREQMSIGLLLAGITLVGVLLALGRVILPDSPVRWGAVPSQVFLALGVVIVFNLIQTTPAIWLSFFPWRMSLLCVFGVIGYAIMLTIVEFFVFTLVAGGGGPNFWEGFRVFAGINVGQVMTIMAVMTCLRLVGFVLHRPGHGPGTSPFRVESASSGGAVELNGGIGPTTAAAADLFRGMDI